MSKIKINANTRRVLNAMRERRITGTELARRTGLNRTFTSQLLYTPISRELAELMMAAIERDDAL